MNSQGPHFPMNDQSSHVLGQGQQFRAPGLPVQNIRAVPTQMTRYQVGVIPGSEQGSRVLSGVGRGCNIIPVQTLDHSQLVSVMQQCGMLPQSNLIGIRSPNVAQISRNCVNQGTANVRVGIEGSLVFPNRINDPVTARTTINKSPVSGQRQQLNLNSHHHTSAPTQRNSLHEQPVINKFENVPHQSNVSLQIPIVGPSGSAMPPVQQGNCLTSVALNLSPPMPTISQPTARGIQNSVKPLVLDSSRMSHGQEHSFRSPSPRFQTQFPVGSRFLGYNPGISNPHPQLFVRTTHSPITVRTSKNPQAQQFRFHQLPGLNFNRAGETVQRNDANNDASVGSVTPNPGGPSRKRKTSNRCNKKKLTKTTLPSKLSSKSVNEVNADSRSHEIAQIKRIKSNTNAHAKKMKMQRSSMSGISQTNDDGITTALNARPNQLALKPKDAGNQKNDVSSKLVDDSAVKKGTGAHNAPTTLRNYTSPARNLIQKDIRTAISWSVFKKGVKINVDKSRCFVTGVYVFDVLVLEKDKSSDYPPLKMQVTDDYPAELPVFLDFHETFHSINNKKIRPRFEEAIGIFRQKLVEMKESEYRIHYLIRLWSLSLMEMSQLHGISIPKAQKKKAAPIRKPRT